jgi:hypothetical protein
MTAGGLKAVLNPQRHLRSRSYSSVRYSSCSKNGRKVVVLNAAALEVLKSLDPLGD